MKYRPSITPGHLRDLQGVVTVVPDRDHSDGEESFRVSHISKGGDISFTSRPIALRDHADAAARVLGEYFHAKEVRLDP